MIYKAESEALAAVSRNGYALEYVPLELKTAEFYLRWAKVDLKALKYLYK